MKDSKCFKNKNGSRLNNLNLNPFVLNLNTTKRFASIGPKMLVKFDKTDTYIYPFLLLKIKKILIEEKTVKANHHNTNFIYSQTENEV